MGGTFTAVSGVARNRLARLNTDGTLDAGFVPDPNGTVASVAVQADGNILIGGGFTTVGGVTRNSIARLANDPATQSLTVPSVSRVEWLRGGASPEAQDVAFELSADGGTTWTPLGAGMRITGGWEKAGLSLPASGLVRARARVTHGGRSFGLVEALATYAFPQLTGLSLSGGGSFQFGFTYQSGVPFTALATTNLLLPSSNWTILGPVTENPPGQYQFTDPAITNHPWRFFRVRSP